MPTRWFTYHIAIQHSEATWLSQEETINKHWKIEIQQQKITENKEQKIKQNTLPMLEFVDELDTPPPHFKNTQIFKWPKIL